MGLRMVYECIVCCVTQCCDEFHLIHLLLLTRVSPWWSCRGSHRQTSPKAGDEQVAHVSSQGGLDTNDNTFKHVIYYSTILVHHICAKSYCWITLPSLRYRTMAPVAPGALNATLNACQRAGGLRLAGGTRPEVDARFPVAFEWCVCWLPYDQDSDM